VSREDRGRGKPTMAPITDVREISSIAYGFMASKALFAALNIDLFGRLSGRAKPLYALVEETGIAPTRLLTLLTACVSLGLLERRDDSYVNAPASQAYLAQLPRFWNRSADISAGYAGLE
jgi:2-hydroxy-4-(methylsulfanyl)butanoate S-methyltransferase